VGAVLPQACSRRSCSCRGQTYSRARGVSRPRLRAAVPRGLRARDVFSQADDIAFAYRLSLIAAQALSDYALELELVADVAALEVG
jgi:hypothetical protein